MKDNINWKTLSTRIAYQNKWMKVREDGVVFPDGKKGIYGVVEKAPFITVIPLVGDKIALVEQFRYPVQAKSWEFPEGLKDAKGEEIKEMVKKGIIKDSPTVAALGLYLLSKK